MKKKILISVIIIVFIILIVFAYRELPFGKPAVVEHFACSDYCRGPAEQYNVKVYEGVKNEFLCWVMGGEIQKYYGWGEYTICVIK